MDPINTLATLAGRSWAEAKAEALAGTLRAADWPEVWISRWSQPLPFAVHGSSERQRAAILAVANYAAAERWAELVAEQRQLEAVEEEERAQEVRMRELQAVLEHDLPPGLHAGRSGEHLFLFDAAGAERTVSTLEQAWRVIAEYEEKRSLL